MRFKALFLGDLRLLWKHGIVAIYGIFTIIYLCLLVAIPQTMRRITATILIFTDPAAMGLFFLGAVVLLEKSQRVESSLGVSPITKTEYILAKILPIMLIGTVVALVLCLFAGTFSLRCILGVILTAALLSLCALAVGANIKSLNGFMIAAVPIEIVLCVPAILFVFGVIKSELWLIHPGVAAIYLIGGSKELWYLGVLSLAAWLIPTFLQCKAAVHKSFATMGGAKL